MHRRCFGSKAKPRKILDSLGFWLGPTSHANATPNTGTDQTSKEAENNMQLCMMLHDGIQVLFTSGFTLGMAGAFVDERPSQVHFHPQYLSNPIDVIEDFRILSDTHAHAYTYTRTRHASNQISFLRFSCPSPVDWPTVTC